MSGSDERGGKKGWASCGPPMQRKRYGGCAQLDGWRMMVDGGWTDGWMDGCGVDERRGGGVVTVKSCAASSSFPLYFVGHQAI
jgi:hypothetical protein